jgi:Zn-dependent membrane protease YugP
MMFLIGWWLHQDSLALIGLILFSAVAIFSLVTLPVEFDASRRGLLMLQSTGILTQQELPGANKVLRAAALTYVAAALQAVGQVLAYMMLLSGRRRV